MKKIIFPFALMILLSTSCSKESQSLRSEDNQIEGVEQSQLEVSPKKQQQIRSNELNLNKSAQIKFTSELHKPAAGLQPIDWKVNYLGESTIEDMAVAHTLLVEYIVQMQNFLEEYPVEKFFFLGVHKEFITKLQLSLALKERLELGLQKLENAEVEKARFAMLQKAFEDLDRSLEEKGMTFKQTEDSLEPVLSIGNSTSMAKALRQELKLYIADGEDLLEEANREYSVLEAGKVQVARAVLEKLISGM